MIIRTQHNKGNPYAQINKKALEDERLSFKSVGILAYLLSRPDNWKTHINQLISSHQDGEHSVRSAIAELIGLGYIKRIRVTDKKGRIRKWELIIRESPDVDFPDVDFPDVDFPDVDFPDVGNRVHNNIDSTKTEINKTKKNNDDVFFDFDIPESEPEQTTPLLVKPEIKAEDQPISENQVSKEDQDLSVTSGKQDPPLPPPHPAQYTTGTAKDLRFDKNIPFPGDINNSCYSQELTRRHFALPEEIAKGVKDTFKYKFGRHLLCMLNAEGIDPIARLSDFLDFYFKQNLNGIGQYKDHNFSHEMLQTKTAQAIASKIEEQKTGVLTQTIEDFKKRIAGTVSTWKPDTTPVFNPEELPPETKEKWEAVKALLAQKSKGVQKTKPKTTIKSPSLTPDELSNTIASLLAPNAILDANPETSSESIPPNSVEKILTATS